MNPTRPSHPKPTNLVVVLLVTACFTTLLLALLLAVLRRERMNVNAITEPAFYGYVLVFVMGSSIVTATIAVITQFTSAQCVWVQQVRDRLNDAIAFMSGICLFFAAAQLIEPMELFGDASSRCVIGVASATMAVVYAALWRCFTTGSAPERHAD